jgi:2-oxoglutarate dehydrogenase E2 component (dihydrolipoamide succinyltransferase)
VQEVRFPKFGMSTVEVEVATIFVKVGDRVAVGDPLVEVETDKVTVSLDAEVAGVVTELRVEEGGEYEVGDVVCLIDDDAAA